MTAPSTVDFYTLSTTIAIAIVGWLFALWLQRENIKHQHKVEIRYDIYKQFVQIRKEAQDAISKLSAYSNAPFIVMDSSMIPFRLGLKKDYKGTWLPYSEQECLFEGEQKWISFVQELYHLYSDFSDKFLKVASIAEDWEAPLNNILSVRDTLNKEVESLKRQIYENLGLLQLYTSKNGHDWRTWDKSDIERITKGIREDSQTIGSYLHDFMVLAHNELVASYFGHARRTRKTLDANYKVLTKDGVVENLDWDMIKKTEISKQQLTDHVNRLLLNSAPPNGTIAPEYEKFLHSLLDGFCPNCNTPLLVMDAEITNDGFHFKYACGHSWKGITLREQIKVHESLKITKKRQGYKKYIQRIFQGYKPSGDSKLPEGVDINMIVDREKNEYHQAVKDNKTGEVLHEEHEPLDQHRSK